MTLSKYSRKIYEPIIIDFEEYDRVVKEQQFEQSRFKSELKVKTKVKRNKKDVGFHFFLLSVGAYFSMLFTSWTSIYEFENTATEINDYSTIWVRFAAIIIGVVFSVTVSAMNLKNIGNY